MEPLEEPNCLLTKGRQLQGTGVALVAPDEMGRIMSLQQIDFHLNPRGPTLVINTSVRNDPQSFLQFVIRGRD